MTHQPRPTIAIRQMTVGDLPLGQRLVAEAGWNQLDGDWLRAIELSPSGCFVAEANGVAVATTATCCFGNIAWIAMVLVDQKMRGQGIAKQLVEHAVTFLDNQHIATIRLDATAFGHGLYQKLGFQNEYEVIRFAGFLGKNFEIKNNIKLLQSSRLIAETDFQITRTDREIFLGHLINGAARPFYYMTENDKIIGFAGYREGRNAIQLGPAIASTELAGTDLLHAIAAQFPKKKAYIDIPVPNKQAISWAEGIGFTEQRRFVRMYRGEPVPDAPQMIWASSGPENG